ncbi:hypothetical protein BGZ96_007983 [Linnemannia gamsii]|uniref:Uncharacterized protein n=1 Tax=Linnemannia gamsii TaxID=64522 RepID=A0ABQ7K0L6_9FUNG|nr:hypothetical protein BGZ96_007983 [Linnemannia gamsii]
MSLCNLLPLDIYFCLRCFSTLDLQPTHLQPPTARTATNSNTMKITHIAIAAAFAQVCIAGSVLPCSIDQENSCQTFLLGNADYYMCICTADPSCQVGNAMCHSSKLQQCKHFCAAKLACNPGAICPVPTECSNKWTGGSKTYKCTQYINM